MSKKNILLAVANGFWLIQEDFVYSNAGLLVKLFNGEPVFDAATEDEEKVSFKGSFSVSPVGEVVYSSRYNPFENAQPNSTAVIGISGPIMKYDNCGDPGTQSYSKLLNLAKANPNINSVVLVIDSPGGTVDGTKDLANQVKAFTKPIVAYVDGMMASAAYWIGSGAKEVVANNETAFIGSIGTMISFMDVQPALEEKGYKFHLITADASVDKNKDYLEARKGNYEGLKIKLNTLNNQFLGAIKNNRSGKIDVSKENVLTGKTYLAEEALAFGLIDKIASFEYAVSRAQALASPDTQSQSQSQSTQTNNMKTTLTLAAHAAIIALCGIKMEAGKESIDVELSAENLTAINDAVAGANALKDSLNATAEKLKAAEEKSAKDTERISALEDTERDLKAELSVIKNPGASGSKANKSDDLGEDDAVSYHTTADDEIKAKRKALYGEEA